MSKQKEDIIILFFDDKCLLCNRLVQWILKNEKDNKILFCALKSFYAKQIIPEQYQDMDTVILLKNKKFYIYLDAFIQIIPHLKWYWKFLYIISILPAFLRKRIYIWIARNRKKWFGTTDKCLLLNSQWKDRLIG